MGASRHSIFTGSAARESTTYEIRALGSRRPLRPAASQVDSTSGSRSWSPATKRASTRFHVAEHHATPLNLVPVPGVYLGAVARLTTRMRLGVLCYLLPLYSPLRLIEEVAILDNLSHGRLEIGVGRGVSPFELNFHNVDPQTSREVFLEALDVLEKGMTSERLDHQGKRFTYKDVPIEVRCLQKPHPADLVSLLQPGRLHLRRRARLQFHDAGAARTRQEEHRRLQGRLCQARRTAGARAAAFRGGARSASTATSSSPTPMPMP